VALKRRENDGVFQTSFLKRSRSSSQQEGKVFVSMDGLNMFTWWPTYKIGHKWATCLLISVSLTLKKQFLESGRSIGDAPFGCAQALREASQISNTFIRM
jgi:hypothetical protein